MLLLTIVGIVTGIVSGLMASYIFLNFFLKRKKPKIEISGHISKCSFKGHTNFFFKFVNKTNCEIYDVNVEATFFKPVGDKKGKNLNGTEIVLEDSFFMYIPEEKRDDAYNLHAMRVRTLQDLEKEWVDDSSFIRVTIMARHSLSGLCAVFHKDFNNKDCISTKKFVSGNDLSVK